MRNQLAAMAPWPRKRRHLHLAAVAPVLMALASIPALAQVAPVPLPPEPPPPPPQGVAPKLDLASRVAPAFPGFDALYGLGGRIILDVTVLATGAIGDVVVERSSGRLELDRAAMAAVRQWRFVPGDIGGTPRGGIVRVPFNFNPQPSTQPPHNPWWPAAYAHPRYVADPEPIAYPSVQAAFEQLPTAPHRSLPDAHAIEQLLVRDAQGQLAQWWVFTDLGTPDAMAVRMVFAGSPQAPIVKVASLCQRTAVCATRQAILLGGPVYARSP